MDESVSQTDISNLNMQRSSNFCGLAIECDYYTTLNMYMRFGI